MVTRACVPECWSEMHHGHCSPSGGLWLIACFSICLKERAEVGSNSASWCQCLALFANLSSPLVHYNNIPHSTTEYMLRKWKKLFLITNLIMNQWLFFFTPRFYFKIFFLMPLWGTIVSLFYCIMALQWTVNAELWKMRSSPY